MAEIAAQLWALLPLAVLVALWRWRAQHVSSLAALLEAAVGFAALVWAGSNLLSAFDVFRPDVLRGVWLGAGALAIVALWRTRSAWPRWSRPTSAVEWTLVAVAVALLAVTFARAVLAPPNTVDVLNYHLPRQLMWLQQGSLAPFATLNDRQNMMPPLAEVIGAQFLALTGDDRWANLPQWAAYAGLAVALAVLVRRLGGSRAAAGVAALLGLLLPMAYHEASNAKNDLLSAFWIVVGAAELARWRAPDFAATRWTALRLALPFTLAWLTKSTAMLFVPPLLVAGLWPWMRRTHVREQLRVLAPAALLALLLIAPFHLRNLAWYGTPLGEHRGEDGGALRVEAMGPRFFASNVLRHASQHVMSPWTGWNAAWLRGVERAHAAMGVDVNDRRTTLWILNFGPTYAPADETLAGAPLHLALGLPLLLALAAGWRAGGDGARVRWLALAVLGGAVLFCAALKWQPWAPRLQLPLFALGIPACVLAVVASWPTRAAGFAAIALGGAVAVWGPGADTQGRTLWQHPRIDELPRELNFYRTLTHLAARDAGLAELVARSGARAVDLQSVHDIAYPLMRRLQRTVPGIHFVGAPAQRGSVDGILVLSLGAPLALYGEYGGRSDWRLVGAGTGDGFYLPDARVRELGWADRLPQFAGWTQQSGLPLAERIWPEAGRLLVREIPSGRGELVYAAVGRPARLRGVVRRDGNAAEDFQITVTVAGQPVGIVEIGRGVAHEFEVQISGAPGVHVVGLQVPASVAREIVFTRLQVTD